MNLKQLIKFGLEESSVPVIKNPILRAALEPRSTVPGPRNMYSQGQLVTPNVDGSRPGYQGEEFSLEKNLSKVPPKIRERFIKVNNYLKKIIPELNAGEKYVTKEQVSSMVEKKFNIKPKYKTIASSAKGFPSDKKLYTKKVNQFEPKSYPVMRNLDSVETKIENTLKNMLIEDEPLNNFWYRALQERTGLVEQTIKAYINESPTFKAIKDQGALSLKTRFNKPDSHSFLKDYSFSRQLKEALDMEKGMPRYTGMGKEKYFTNSPKFKVFEFAKRNFRDTKGEGAIKYFTKNGKPIMWEYGLKLPYKEVYFTYNGKKYSASDKIKNTNNLTNIEILKKDFPEVYKNQTAINKLRIQEVDNPFEKGKITLEDLVKRNQVNTYRWGKGTSVFDILHGREGVKGEPFTNLSFNTRDINQLEMGIDQSKILSATEKNKIAKLINELGGSGDPEAIKKRQIGLAKDIESGKIQSYGDMQKKFFKNKDFVKWVKKFPCMKADGGTPDIACHLKGMRHEKNLLAEGKGSRAMANKFIDGTKMARKGGALKAIFGLGGLIGDVVFEGAYAAYNYTQGKDAADIWRHSWYSFMDPSMWKDGKYVGWVEDAEKQKQYEIRDEEGNVTGIRKNVKRYYDNVDKVEQQLNLFDNITEAETADLRGYEKARPQAIANAKKALSDFHTSLGPPGGMERIYKELEYDQPYVETRQEATDVEKVENKRAAFEKMKEAGGFSKDKEYADRFDKPSHYKKRYDEFIDFRTTAFDKSTKPSFYLPKGKLHQRVEDPRYGVPYATRGGPKAQADITGEGLENYLMFEAAQAGEPITREEATKLKWQLISETGGIDLQDKIGIAGGVANMAGGGMVGIRKPNAIAPTGGPQSQGLASTPEYDTYSKEYKWQI